MEKALRIGEVAGRAGVNVQTLRFYERRGLLPEPPRRASGYREYAPESVRRVRFIKRAQELGFTLAEVEELLRLREDPRIPCREVRATAETKIADIEEKMRRLPAMRAALAALVESCAANREHHCPLLEALDESPVRSRTRGAKSSRSHEAKS
jgi:MerR family mercuric resistance operon transcriptional regulator